MTDKLLDALTVAGIVGLAPTTLAKLRVFGGGPPFVKLGRRVLYSEGELRAWIEARPRFQNTTQVTERSRRRVR